jgi:hypothetical protein
MRATRAHEAVTEHLERPRARSPTPTEVSTVIKGGRCIDRQREQQEITTDQLSQGFDGLLLEMSGRTAANKIRAPK